jgi:hypothetical protein
MQKHLVDGLKYLLEEMGERFKFIAIRKFDFGVPPGFNELKEEESKNESESSSN